MFTLILGFAAALAPAAAAQPRVEGLQVAAAKPSPSAKPSAKPSPKPVATPAPVKDAEELDLENLERLLSDDPDAKPLGGPSSQPLALPNQAPLSGLIKGPQGNVGNNVMNPNISLIMDGAVAAFSSDQPLQSGNHDPKATGFTLQQVEMALNSNIDVYMRFDSNIVFSQFGVEIEEAYATTLSLPYDLQARAGQFLTRFGRANTMHPHSWHFVDQPFFLGKVFGGENNHGLGFEGSWLAPLPWYTEVVASATEAHGGGTARSFFGNENLGMRSPTDALGMLGLRQFYLLHRDWSLAWGLSAMSGPNASGRTNRSDVYGGDAYLKWRPLTGASFQEVTLTTEALGRRRQLPGTVLADHGGYGALTWHFAQRWGTAVRWDYGSGVLNDPLDPDWTGDRNKYTANLTFWPTEFSRIRLQGSMDRPSWRPEPIYAGMLTLETVIGAHGAHHF